MSANPDFKDLFSVFNAENVEYLVVGAHAVIFYAEPRYTKDLDIWVNPAVANAARVWQALGRFGAPLRGMSVLDFCSEDTVYQIGIEPNRIDILMGLGGVNFRQAFENCSNTTYDGVPIRVIGRGELVEAKRIAGRRKDLLDIKRLQAETSASAVRKKKKTTP